MKSGLSLWNIHNWLDERDIEHFYALEDGLPLFEGIRFHTPDIDRERFALVQDVTDNTQYRSVLSFKDGRIYFRTMQSDEAMNLLNEMLYAYHEWQSSLTSAIISHASLNELLFTASSLFSFPLTVICNNRIEARSCRTENGSRDHPEQIVPGLPFYRCCYEAMNNASVAEDTLILQTAGHGTLMMSQIPFRNHYVLLISEASGRNISQADLLLFARISHAVGNHLKNRREVTGKYYNSAHYVFSSFAEGAVPSRDLLSHILDDLGWKTDDKYQVFCIRFKKTEYQSYPALLYIMLRSCFPDCYTLIRDEHILLFLNASRSECIPDESGFSKMLPGDQLYIGQSSLHTGISNMPFLIRQAEQALLTAVQTKVMLVNAETISTQAVLKQFYSDASLQAMVHPAIIFLGRLDEGNKAGFDYLKTLEVYLSSGTNISAASRKLGLHRNTLINRIERIKDLTGLSLSDPSELEALLLSLIVFNRYTTME